MPMKTVQIRLTPEQLERIDEKVEEGLFQSRPEAIRDYIRKAEFFEALTQFRALATKAGLTEDEVWKDDAAIRKAPYQKPQMVLDKSKALKRLFAVLRKKRKISASDERVIQDALQAIDDVRRRKHAKRRA